jgi:hypothetical protein
MSTGAVRSTRIGGFQDRVRLNFTKLPRKRICYTPFYVCVWVCGDTHTHLHTLVHTHTITSTHQHTHTHTNTHTNTHTHAHTGAVVISEPELLPSPQTLLWRSVCVCTIAITRAYTLTQTHTHIHSPPCS